MTAKVNNTEATAVVNDEGNITLTLPNGDVTTLTVKQVTATTDALLAARKVAYTRTRVANEAAKAAAKAERDQKSQKRKAAAKKRQADKKAKLEKQLAELNAPKPAKKTGTSGRRAAKQQKAA